MDWEDIEVFAWTALVMVFVLAVCYMAGSASAGHAERQQNERMACLDRGGHIAYEPNIGEICKK